MDFRFTAHNPQTGEFLHRLPRAEKVQIGDTFGTRGTLEVTFSAKALNAKPMPTFAEIRQEVTFDDGNTWTQIGPNYLRLSGSHEDTDQAGMRDVTFVSREWLLGKARVGEGDLPLIDNKRPFYQSSPGQIMRTLLLEAKDRGAAQGIEIGGFTSGRDSSGNAWSKVATIYYSPGLPILNVLENLVEQGLCDYKLEGNTLNLFEPETTMGIDHTTGTNPVRVHGSVTEAPVNYTLEDLTTSALLIGEDGFELEVDNPSAPDDYGRLEVTIEQGGVNQEGTARIMVDEALNRGSREIREITRTQRADGLKFLPYRDYRVGDFVQVRDLGRWQRYRVREIQAVREKDGWTVHTVLNDRLQELLLKLAKRTNGIVNGSQGSGGDGTQPAPPAKPGIEPAAPEGLILDQQVYLDRQGVARGVVTAGWGAVTESTQGKAVEIGGYELWWRRNETLAVWTRAAVTAGDTSVSHSPVVLSDTDGTAMEYQWRVRAVAEASARPGPWSESVTLTMTQDTEPPNMPSTPDVKTDLRIITVGVDGLDEYGEAMPVDYNHHRIYFAESANMANAVQVGTLSNPGTWNSESMDADTPVYVAVTAVDNVGNESDMTPSQLVTPQKLVDDAAIREQLDGLADGTLIEDDAITTPKILAGAITAAKIAALAIEADHIAANAITADKIRAGAIDSMLITGAHIRTAASGRRTELDVEGLQSFDTSGRVVLTTSTSDGSVDMRGNLTQTIKGITMSVGDNFAGANPGISWTDTRAFATPPGIMYGEDAGDRNVYIQGPGSSSSFSGLKVTENGDGFDLFATKSSSNWRVIASHSAGQMNLGTLSGKGPSVLMRRGTGTTGQAFVGYEHPSNGGYSSMALRDRYMWLGAYDSNGNVVSRLFGDSASTELTAGTRDLSLRGKDVSLSPTADLSLNPGGKLYAPGLRRVSSAEHMGRDGDVVLISSSRKYKLIEEPIEATVESFEDKLLSVDAKTWVDRSRAEMIADHQTAIANGEEPEEYPSGMSGLERIPGVVAEDMIDAGLDMFVCFENGEPESVLYDRIGPALIPIIRRLRDRVDALETQLGENKCSLKCHPKPLSSSTTPTKTCS